MLRPLIGCVAVLAAAATACSSGDGVVTSPAATSQSASTSTATRTALPEPIVNDSPTVPLADRLVHVWNIDGDPDWLESVGGLIWVKRDDGTVSAVAPDAANPIANVATGYSSVPAWSTTARGCGPAPARTGLSPSTRPAAQPVSPFGCPGWVTRAGSWSRATRSG